MSIKFVLKRNLPTTQTTNNPTIAEYDFDAAMFTIGSDSANNLVLKNAAFEQAVIVREGEQIMLINSADGTKLNGQSLRREAIEPIAIGDRIEIGEYLILVTDGLAQHFTEENSALTSSETALTETPLDLYATTKFNTAQIETSPTPVTVSEKISEEITTNAVKENTDKSQNPRNFADILDTLRTEDDSFYFTVKTDAQELRKITLEQSETPLGVSTKGEIVATTEEIASFAAMARKDWSGILLESQKPFSFSVNGEKIENSVRLRHDDKIVFANAPKISLILHEPSSLVALESLLSSRSSPNLRLNNQNENIHSSTQIEKAPESVPKDSFLERKYFKYFSFVELVSMIIGTLIGAVIIFLFLEFLFS